MLARQAQRAASALQKQGRASKDKGLQRLASRKQSQAALRLRVEKRLRRFLRDHPGWHTIPDACAAMDIPDGESSRRPYYSVTGAMVAAGLLERRRIGITLYFRKVVDTL